jgi:sugar transferase (PEP-CTERM/EpsH1 system associated)
MERKRILHIIQNLNYGGMERLLADLVQRTDTRRFESHVLALEYLGRFARGLEDCAELHLERPRRGTSMIWPDRLARRIRQIGPDVVHTHAGVWYKGSLAARGAGVPRIVHTEHGHSHTASRFETWLRRRAARRTDVVVAVSEPLARDLRATILRDGTRLEVVINGVDTDRFSPNGDTSSLREELNLSAHAPIIGSVGRLEPIKGYDVMLRAFARLREREYEGPPPALALVGEGSERCRLEADARAHGLADSVRFLGWRDDIERLLASFSIFTLSSRSEGTSVSLLEAMSSAVCPVVTDVGGNLDVLGEDLRHRAVPPEDPDALARAWNETLSDVAARTADGRTARARVEQRFSIEAMVSRYERIYAGEMG